MDVLVVDGYNIIGDWDELKKLKQRDIGLARDRLIEILIEYRAYTKRRVIIVFDALYVKGTESKQRINGVEIIFTKENETADECIERLIKSLKNVRNQVYVATSDYLEQRTVFSRGALRISARELFIEISTMETSVREQLDNQINRELTSKIELKEHIREKLEKWRRGEV
ncbi:MAG TPA: NYN domain-containing protein [Pseudogracilibacillus sp.]|nr:NYN domain-containing protein [Pseudogracilibacillus sp.]